MNLVKRSVKWRFQNPVTIMLTLIQPLMWLLLFSKLFGANQENYTQFVIAGILVMAILFGSGMSGISNYSLKANGSYYRVLISPIKRRSIIIAHALDAEILSFIQLGVLLLLSFLLGVRIETGVLGFLILIPLLAVTSFFVSTLSYFLSTVISDENGFIAVINTFTLPLFFVSTALISKELIPGIFKIPAAINPFSYVIDSIRNIMIETSVNWELYLIAMAIMVMLSILNLKRRNRRKVRPHHLPHTAFSIMASLLRTRYSEKRSLKSF